MIGDSITEAKISKYVKKKVIKYETINGVHLNQWGNTMNSENLKLW